MEKTPIIIISVFLSIFILTVVYLGITESSKSEPNEKTTIDVTATNPIEIDDKITANPNTNLNLEEINLGNEQPGISKLDEKMIPNEEEKTASLNNSKTEPKALTKMTTQEKITVAKPTTMIDLNKSYKAVISTTKGDITVELNAKATPITVNNFVYLAKMGFYDDTIFHRVIKGFMIQGGDPLGNGTGGPAYKFDDEEFEGEYTRGTIAMANSGSDTNGSQFFIMHGDNALPKNYVIFGKVTAGLDIVDKIAESEVTMSRSGEMSAPVEPTRVTSIAIVER